MDPDVSDVEPKRRRMLDATGPRSSHGFSLVEIAVALFLLAVLFGALVMPLQTQVLARKTGETQKLLDKAREVLLGYASAHGYFPCPATETSGGREPAASDHASGTCATYYGFLPGALLGLQSVDSQGYALDGWASSGNRIRYAVANHTVGGVNQAFTRTNGMRTAGISNLAASSLSLFHVCSSAAGVVAGSNCGSAVTLVSTTPVLIWSSGENAARGAASADEAQNPHALGGSADRIFVSRLRGVPAVGDFDDQVTWIPMPTIISRLVAAGRLP
jgi:prepilin-type N-terminal cleavage/methylation domain-containing protein